MLGWILNNFAVFLTIIVILVAIIVILVIFLRKKPTVTKVNEKKEPEPEKKEETPPPAEEKEEKPEQPEKITEMSEEEENDERKKKVDYESIDKKISEIDEQKKSQKKKLFQKRKREVTRVFEPKKQEVVQQEEVSEINEEEFLKSRQFVKSGKKISKLVSLPTEHNPEEVQEATEQAEVKPEEVVASPEESKPAEKPSRIRKREGYFDRSKRLRNSIEKNSFDDMFVSHISGDYLSIESDRHLTESKYSENLYKRTSDMLANSSAKVLISGEKEQEHVTTDLQALPSTSIKSDKDYMRDWLDKKRHEELYKIMNDSAQVEEEPAYVEEDNDTVNLDAKNLLVVSSVMKRKKFKK